MSRYALPLPGFEQLSVWGYDDIDRTYFAQLWPNGGDPDDEPDVWLSWSAAYGAIEDPLLLADLIAGETGLSSTEVLTAMAEARPSTPVIRGIAAAVAVRARMAQLQGGT